MRVCERWAANDYLHRCGQSLEPACDHDPTDCPPHREDHPMTDPTPTPTTLADWATHCRDKAAAWDKVSPLIRDHSADWRALADLAWAAREPQTGGVEDGPRIAAVARLAAKLEQP